MTTAGLLEKETIEVMGSPRRITAICKSLLQRQPDSEKEVTGPPKSVAYDNVGQPTRAAISFAEKQGVPLSKVYTVSTQKGEYVAAKLVTLGRPAEAILAEILPRAVAEIAWPRSMYWTVRESMRFIRPIRWVVALLDGKVLKLEIAGVRAGRETCRASIPWQARSPD